MAIADAPAQRGQHLELVFERRERRTGLDQDRDHQTAREAGTFGIAGGALQAQVVLRRIEQRFERVGK